MVGYMRLEEQVDADFSRALRRALLRKVRFRLRRNNSWERLLCFDDLRKIPGAVGRVYRGMRAVSVQQIGGSVGRCAEVDRRRGDGVRRRRVAEQPKGQGGPYRGLLKRRSEDARDDGYPACKPASPRDAA